jgi:carbonic anhydrase/acetyltransferase-like protein (isoleucine patch superfamily)
MPLYSPGDLSAQVGEGAWAASVRGPIGDVHLGARASIWFGAIVRADNTPIIVGVDSNIQDGSVCHSDEGFPLAVGASVTVGQQAILHGCTI